RALELLCPDGLQGETDSLQEGHLFVTNRLDSVESRRLVSGIQAEHDPGDHHDRDHAHGTHQKAHVREREGGGSGWNSEAHHLMTLGVTHRVSLAVPLLSNRTPAGTARR